MTRVLVDATTLIALGTVGELDHLTALDGEIVVPPLVRAEVTTNPASTALTRFLDRHDIDVTAAAGDHRAEASTLLGEPDETGDVQIVAGVLAANAADRSVGVVSDDRRVRTTARGLGATVTGTVGVVVRAVDEGYPAEAAHDLVDRLDDHGLHMTADLRARAEALVDEAATRTDD